MALIVTARNVRRNKENTIADYEVIVWINDRQIWSGQVGAHVRAEGWQKLLKKIAATAENAGREFGK